MNTIDSVALVGHVASLHLHPVQPGEPMAAVEALELIEGKGIIGDHRYFGRLSRTTGQLSQRQVSLMEREQIAEHAAALEMAAIAPGAVRANIETTALNLVSLIGKELAIGEAVLFLFVQRDPCARMDAIRQGLRERMMHGKQGVLAEVRQGGRVKVGDTIHVRSLASAPTGSQAAT